MSVRDGKCGSCGAALADAEGATRTGEKGGYRVTAKDIPVQRCPKGCAGLYWAHLDVGVDAIDLLHEQEGHFCSVKGFLFWMRDACRGCDGELAAGPRAEFAFGPLPSSRSPKMTLLVDGPTLACAACKRAYLPAMRYQGDERSKAQADAIGAAVTNELISD